LPDWARQAPPRALLAALLAGAFPGQHLAAVGYGASGPIAQGVDAEANRRNRGVELSPEVIDGPASLITAQVASGLLVRMAILYEILAGGERPRPLSRIGGDRSEASSSAPIGEPA